MVSQNDELILLVDDRAASRYATSRILQNAGFQIVEATTGSEALDVVSSKFSLVVLDVNLPDLDGHEVCRRIRQRPDVCRMPVIHLSATFVSDDHKIKGLEAGSDGYLTHPVDPLVLIATVKSFLRARQMEAEVVKSEAKFRAVFDHALIGICIITNDMIYLDANPALCKILGREPDEIIGKHCSSFMSVGTEGRIQEIANHLESHETWRGMLPLLRSDGHVVQLDWSMSIHSAPNIRLAVITDVTEKQKILAEREELLISERAARTAAEKANRLKDEFLATLSHELRTPLGAIVGWAQVLQIRPPSKEDLAEGLATIERSAKNQAELINDLLDVSRIMSGKMRLNLASANPVAIVRNALSSVLHVAQEQGVRIEESFPASSKPIVCDPSRIQQVIWNLVNNAVKFTPRGGRIEVELRQTPASVVLVVSDTGKGIKPEFLPHLFERFRQEDSTTTRVYGGWGLGLAIVQHLVELHGGTVTAHSAGEGCGAQFVVHLPQGGPEPSIRPSSNANPNLEATNSNHSLIPANFQGIRILVVDDDPGARNLTGRILREFHATVSEASTVAEALETLQSFRPQVLVSDIGMPQSDGYDLIREVRRRGYDRNMLPAVAITAFTREADRHRVLDEGFQAHLGKPIEVAGLISTIANLVQAISNAPAQ